jgi:hypothetical protein
MASSRWKRFAFFDRQSLSLASEVLEDLIPIGGAEGRGSRRSVNSNRVAAEASNDSVTITVATVALPLKSKPKTDVLNGDDETVPLTNMWSSLNACTATGLEGIDEGSIRLPSQAQYFEDDSTVASSGTAIDGLVLVFVTSRDTDYVHCFDLTVRCNPPDSPGKDLEDMDGWRGYFAPLKNKIRKPVQTGASLEDRIISEHMTQEKTEGIVHIATCRATSGHRPLHMACITQTNVVVCVDPHLYLSW